MNLFGGALPQANIKVYRATGIQLGRTGATSITEEFKKGRAFQKSVAENEAQWIPEPLNDSARLSRYPARLVFSVAREGQAPRLSGLTDLAFGSASKAVWMDAQGDLVSPDTVMSTPVWRPATEGGDKTGLAALTTSGLSCGKQRLVYLRDPRCGGAASCPPPVELASACEKGVLSTSNSGVHYPSWSAGMEAKPERIAYVRGDPGKGWQVCVRIAPLANPPGPQRCFESIDGMAVSRSFPTWSADGRYLVYYEVGPARAARGNAAADEKEARLKGIDLQGAACQDLKAATCKPTTWVTRFRPNNELGARGPALLTRGGRTWAFVIGEKAATHTDVWAIPLDHPEERKVFPSGLVNLRSIDAIEVTDPVTKASEVRLALVAQGYDGVVGDRKDYDKVFVLPVALP